MLEHEAYEVWCPHHADSDNSDEDYSLAAPRSRRTTGECFRPAGPLHG